ncbi:MAG: hypothetical protein ABIQ95_14065, partial [Bdellovibrionia bacterium]
MKIRLLSDLFQSFRMPQVIVAIRLAVLTMILIPQAFAEVTSPTPNSSLGGAEHLNISEINQKYPQWVNYIENSYVSVAESITKKDFKTLSSILSAVDYLPFTEAAMDILAENIEGDSGINQEVLHLFEVIAEEQGSEAGIQLAIMLKNRMSNSDSNQWRKTIQLLIKKKSSSLGPQIGYLLMSPTMKDWKEEIELFREGLPKVIRESDVSKVPQWDLLIKSWGGPRKHETEAIRQKLKPVLESTDVGQIVPFLPLMTTDRYQEWDEGQKLLKKRFKSLIDYSQSSSVYAQNVKPPKPALVKLLSILDKGHSRFWDKERELLRKEIQSVFRDGSEGTKIELAIALNASNSDLWTAERTKAKREIEALLRKDANSSNKEFSSKFLSALLFAPRDATDSQKRDRLEPWRQEVRGFIKQGNDHHLDLIHPLFTSKLGEQWKAEYESYLSTLKNKWSSGPFPYFGEPSTREKEAIKEGMKVRIKNATYLKDLKEIKWFYLSERKALDLALSDEDNNLLDNKIVAALDTVDKPAELVEFLKFCMLKSGPDTGASVTTGMPDAGMSMGGSGKPLENPPLKYRWPHLCAPLREKVNSHLASLKGEHDLPALRKFRDHLAPVDVWSHELNLVKSKIAAVVDKFIDEHAKPASKKMKVYRWGESQYELVRTKGRLGKGKPAFDLCKVNAGGGTQAGSGLYAACNPIDSATYVKKSDYALVEISVPKGTLTMDLVDDPELRKEMDSRGIQEQDIYNSNAPIAIKYPWGSNREWVPAWVLKSPNVSIKHFKGEDLTLEELSQHHNFLKKDYFAGSGAPEYFKSRLKDELKKRVFIPDRLDVAPVDPRSCRRLSIWDTDKRLSQVQKEVNEVLEHLTSHPGSLKYYWRYDGSCGSYVIKNGVPHLS